MISNHAISDAIVTACRNDAELNQIVSDATSGKKLFYHIGLNLDDHGRYDIELYNPDLDSSTFTRDQQKNYRTSLLIDTIGRTDEADQDKYQIGLQVTLAQEKEYKSESGHIEVGTDFIRYKGIDKVEDICIKISDIVHKLTINGITMHMPEYETQPLPMVSNLSIYKGYILCTFTARRGIC